MQAEQKRRFEAWKKLENPKYQPTDDSMQDRRDWMVWNAALSHPSTPTSVESYYALQLLVAAAHITQEKADEALHLAREALQLAHEALPPPPEQGSSNV